MAQRQTRPLTNEELAVVAEEERLLAAVRAGVAEARGKTHGRPERLAAMASLRDDYTSARAEDKPAMLAQMHEEAARDEASLPKALPDLGEPYLGHLRIRSAGRVREVLLGPIPFLDAGRGVTLVDWRRAPIAEVFWSSEPGDDYEIEVEGRVIEGVLERSHVVAFERGELAVISVPGGALVRGPRTSGGWLFEPGGFAPRLAASTEPPVAARGEARIAALLDAHQLALLARDPAEPLLVLGSAGSGKTTVALHRVAMLTGGHPDRFDPRRVLVVVPEPGLRRFAERMLDDLKVERVAVRTFDDWIRTEARRLFPGLPRREDKDPPFASSRMKRHPALLVAIDHLIDELAAEMAGRLERALDGKGAIRAAFAARAEPILAERMRLAEEILLQGARAEKKAALADAFREERARLTTVRPDLVRLVGDRALLRHAVRASVGGAGEELTEGLVEQVAAHTGSQIDEPTEARFTDVELDRRTALDGRSLDEGTPDDVAGTLDVEDYALLFELLWRKTGTSGTRIGHLSRYAHVVVDEAQELAPIELRVLGRAVDPEGGSVTVAGDAAQRIDRSSYFASWEAVMEALGTAAAPAYLETSYRCPRPIVVLAHEILGPEAPEAVPRAHRDGAEVLFSVVPSEGHAALEIVHALRELRGRDPAVSVAVLARDADAARALHDIVSRAITARLVRDGEFSFGPGVEITAVAEVKGLEFDYVIIPDASARHYPSTPEHRRALHVAVTRASRQAWILSPGAPSPILPAATTARQSGA